MSAPSPCLHPTGSVYYESYEDEDGVTEKYWCAECNLYLGPVDVQEIRERPDWVTWRTE
jgi:hypothetical protein